VLQVPHRQIAAVLRHERKTNSYKVALVRALGDLALAFPDVGGAHDSPRDVAVPLRAVAEFWLAYYWPFCEAEAPLLQGARAADPRTGGLRNDIAFRGELEELRTAWEAATSSAAPSDGYLLVEEMRSTRRREMYPNTVRAAFATARRKAAHAVQQPVKYAGAEHWSLFSRPAALRQFHDAYAPLDVMPGTAPQERCIVVKGDLWLAFRELSLWVEALAVHTWCLWTEGIDQSSVGRGPARRGELYELLTARPDNRRPLSWERNEVDLLMIEGHHFECPWTGRELGHGAEYDLDHLIPVALYPTNEMWNLIPADRHFNQRVKRDRLPSAEALRRAEPRLVVAYDHYLGSKALGPALRADVHGRFAGFGQTGARADDVARAATAFIATAAEVRSVQRFG
jgi:hypothetical protein